MKKNRFAHSFRWTVLASLLVATGAIAAYGQQPASRPETGRHRLTLQDLLSLRPIGETALSPDGKTIAMTENGQIVLMPSEGGWPETLTSTQGGKNGLSWSPDGRTIAYASGGSIWVVPAVGGNPRRLTHAMPGPGDPRSAADRGPQFSPAGKWILFETGRRGRNSLMVVSEDGMTDNYLTDSMGDEGAASWSPDGREIAYVERTPAYFSGKLKILKFNPESGEAEGQATTLYTSPTDRGGGWSIRKPQWSPDGRELAVVLQDSGWNHIYLIPAAGGEPKALTQGDYEDETAVFSPDGKSLAVVSNRKMAEEYDIWIVPADGGTARELAPFDTPGAESFPIWSPDGSKIFFHRTTPVESNDLLVASVAGGSAPAYLTHTTPRNFDAGLITPEKVQWQGKDGLNIVGILYEPPEMKAGTRYPAILWIHGGPEGQDTFRLDPWAQYLAQHGYLVLEPNYRGGAGYGEKFRNLNVGKNGTDMDDVAAGAQWLIAQGHADPKRMAIGGGSHGGTMVAYAVIRYPDLFQAAIDLYGVADRANFVERTNRGSAIRWIMKMGGTPEEQPEEYLTVNAIAQVDKIKTPLLIMCGQNDPQVPPYESYAFAKALKAHGKVFYYYTYPNELHGFSQPAHRLDAWHKELAFLEKYVNMGYGLSTPSIDDLLVPATAGGPGGMQPQR